MSMASSNGIGSGNSSSNDPASQSNPDEVLATHVSLVMDVDFDSMVIQGYAEYTVEIKVC